MSGGLKIGWWPEYILRSEPQIPHSVTRTMRSAPSWTSGRSSRTNRSGAVRSAKRLIPASVIADPAFLSRLSCDVRRRSGRSAAAGPVRVLELAPRTVDSLILMRAEVVALCLKEVRGQPRVPDAVEVGERRHVGGDPDAVRDRGRDDAAPRGLRRLDVLAEERV